MATEGRQFLACALILCSFLLSFVACQPHDLLQHKHRQHHHQHLHHHQHPHHHRGHNRNHNHDSDQYDQYDYHGTNQLSVDFEDRELEQQQQQGQQQQQQQLQLQREEERSSDLRNLQRLENIARTSSWMSRELQPSGANTGTGSGFGEDRQGLRRKRNNRRMNLVKFRTMTDNERTLVMKKSRVGNEGHPLGTRNGNVLGEVEIREAQNTSLCNYTVEVVPDETGLRIPQDLINVRCNHVGSTCRGEGRYCCTQTYRDVEVRFGIDGPKETIKLLAGCVCSLQLYGELSSPGTELPPGALNY